MNSDLSSTIPSQPGKGSASKVCGLMIVAFCCGLLIGGFDFIRSQWYQMHLNAALRNFSQPPHAQVWDGWDDALYYWDRLKQSGHEADAVRVLLETRDAPGSLVYGQALYVLSTKMVESHREVVAELSRELQNPSLSERKKNDIRATLETIQKGLAENFPQEIEPVK